MEIVIGIIFFCVVVALCYSWARSTETPEEAMTPADPRYGLYHNAANNYPVGDPDRRLKGYRGPYPSRDEAVAVGRQEKDVWYPKVEYLEGPPY